MCTLEAQSQRPSLETEAVLPGSHEQTEGVTGSAPAERCDGQALDGPAELSDGSVQAWVSSVEDQQFVKLQRNDKEVSAMLKY